MCYCSSSSIIVENRFLNVVRHVCHVFLCMYVMYGTIRMACREVLIKLLEFGMDNIICVCVHHHDGPHLFRQNNMGAFSPGGQ